MIRFTKKALALALSLVLALSVGLTAFAAASGDLTGDNKIGTADARKILRAAIGLDTLSAAEKDAADVNLDGAITTADARMALRVAVGLEKSDGKLYKNQYDVLRSGFFFADLTVTDSAGAQDMLIAATPDSTYLQMMFTDAELKEEFGIDAIQIDLLFKGEKAYLLDPANRAYGEFPFEAMGMSKDELGDMTEAREMFNRFPSLDKASSKEKGKYNGASCTAYTFNYNNGALKVFMDGKKLLAIAEYDEKNALAVLYEFRAAALTVPTACTEIPSGYEAADPIELMLTLFFGDLLKDLDP